MIPVNKSPVRRLASPAHVRAPGLRGCAALLLAASLAACAPAPTRPVALADEAAQAKRELLLSRETSWSFTGRLAISQAGNGGNARIEWKQDRDDFDIRLSAPITGQSWRLRSTAGRVSLEGLEGGVREGTDAEGMLMEATGWRIPLASMAAWVRGARAPGPSEMTADPAALPATLVQGGWLVEFKGWNNDRPPLPSRVFAGKADARVRLVIERWNSP